MYACFAMDLLAEYREQQVASQARSTALRVRFIVGDRAFTKSFLYQIHHLHPLFLHNACSVPRRNDLCLCICLSVRRATAMARKTRGSLINPIEVTIVHTVAKTARNLFVLGEDFATRTHNSHRKAWIHPSSREWSRADHGP